MRKLLFLSVIMSVFCADFGAFAAPARGGARGGSRGGTGTTTATSAGNKQSSSGAPVAARAGKRNVAKTTQTAGGKTTAGSASGAPVAARAGKRNVAKTTTTAGGKTTTGGKQQNTNGATAARAGAKQKAINMGTKVAETKENTMIDQECRDAFYGCMDSMCKLDNASGGRCRCDDRVTDLDKVLDFIMDLNSQIETIQVDGVRRVQMGEDADAVLAMAKDASKKALKEDNSQGLVKIPEEKEKKIQNLNLNTASLSSGLFDTDVFEDEEEGEKVELLDENFGNKKGAELKNAALKMCVAGLSDNCKKFSMMLQGAYSAQIKSDCVAYENGLKEQKITAEANYKTAERALRDAALEAYQNKNKYKSEGECAFAFKECMMEDQNCGSDWSKCVINPLVATADEQQKVKSITTGATKVDINAVTYDMLHSKFESGACIKVLNQCQNLNKNKVWETFVVSVAAELKSAELSAEDNRRRNCVNNVVECISGQCSQNGAEEGSDQWVSCAFSNSIWQGACKVTLDQCGADDPSMLDGIKANITAVLSSKRVDECTKQVKECLLSESACGKDYTACVGLSTQQIMDLCPTDKLVACMTDETYSGKESEVLAYVAKVAQGLAMNIDSNMLKQCQEAATAAFKEICGDDEGCPNVKIDEFIAKGDLSVSLCKEGTSTCHEDPYAFNANDVLKGLITTRVIGQVDIDSILYNVSRVTSVQDTKDVKGKDIRKDIQKKGKENNKTSTASEEVSHKVFYANNPKVSSSAGYSMATLNKLLAALNNAYDRTIKEIEATPKVQYCMTGRNFQQFSDKQDAASQAKVKARFPDLTKSIRGKIARELLSKVYEPYYTALDEINDDQKVEDLRDSLNKRIAEVLDEKKADKLAYYKEYCRGEPARRGWVNSKICWCKKGDGTTYKWTRGDVTCNSGETKHCGEPSSNVNCKLFWEDWPDSTDYRRSYSKFDESNFSCEVYVKTYIQSDCTGTWPNSFLDLLNKGTKTNSRVYYYDRASTREDFVQ